MSPWRGIKSGVGPLLYPLVRGHAGGSCNPELPRIPLPRIRVNKGRLRRYYRDGTDPLDVERRRAAVRRNHVTNATRNILWQRPANPDAVAMFRKFAINAASMTSDRITAVRCIGRHSPSCLKRRDTRIVPAVRLRNAKGPLIRWIVPEIVCVAPSGSIGKLIAIRTPTAHIPNRPRPIPERARLDTPRLSPITRAKEPRLILKKAELIRNPYRPTAYSLVGVLIGLRPARRKCNTTMMTAK